MRVLLLVAILPLILVGCATAPPLPKVQLEQGTRVGFLVEGGKHPVHTHIGTTIFNNFEKVYEYDWRLSELTVDNLVTSLEVSGYTPVDLSKHGFTGTDLADLVVTKDNKWVYAQGKSAILTRLQALNLKAVMLLKETQVVAALECSGGPCSSRIANGSGLYSRGFFGIDRYHAVSAYRWGVYTLEVPSNIASSEAMRKMLRIPSIELPNYPTPKDFKNLSADEFTPALEAIEVFNQKVAAQATTTLRGKTP